MKGGSLPYDGVATVKSATLLRLPSLAARARARSPHLRKTDGLHVPPGRTSKQHWGPGAPPLQQPMALRSQQADVRAGKPRPNSNKTAWPTSGRTRTRRTAGLACPWQRWEEACQSPGMMAALMAEDDRLQSSFTAAVIAREASQETAVSAVRHSDAQIVKLAQGSVLAKHVRQQAIAQLAHRQACLF